MSEGFNMKNKINIKLKKLCVTVFAITCIFFYGNDVKASCDGVDNVNCNKHDYYSDINGGAASKTFSIKTFTSENAVSETEYPFVEIRDFFRNTPSTYEVVVDWTWDTENKERIPVAICNTIENNTYTSDAYSSAKGGISEYGSIRSYVYFNVEQVDNAINNDICKKENLVFTVDSKGWYKKTSSSEDNKACAVLGSGGKPKATSLKTVKFDTDKGTDFSLSLEYHGGTCVISSTNKDDSSISLNGSTGKLDGSSCNKTNVFVECDRVSDVPGHYINSCSLYACLGDGAPSDGIVENSCVGETVGVKCEYARYANQTDVIFYNVKLDSMKSLSYFTESKYPSMRKMFDSVSKDVDANGNFFRMTILDGKAAALSENIRDFVPGETCPSALYCDSKESTCYVSEEGHTGLIKHTLHNSYTFCENMLKSFIDYGEMKVEERASNNRNTYKPICGLFKSPDDGGKLFDFILNAYKVVKVIVPVLVIILTIVEFLKVLFSGEDKSVKAAFKATTTRFILIAVLVFVPFILELIIKISGLSEDCLQYFVK